MRYYPVFLDLAGQRCVVIGDGPLAEEKVAGLKRAGASVEHLAAGQYRKGVLDGARLVFDASDDVDLNRRTWAEAEAAGILINVVDRTHQCRFIMPAVVDRDPLLIAISTSGESPFVASSLRTRLERQFDQEWGPLVATIGATRRALRARGVSLEVQLKTYRKLLRSPLRCWLRQGGEQGGRFRAASVQGQAGQLWPGWVDLVGAGRGDPGLVTLAAVDQLGEADVVFHDALVSAEVLRFCGPKARLVDVGKRGSGPATEQDTICRWLLEAAEAGQEVVRLKGGDPFVFGRGGEEMDFLIRAGIEVVVIPGVSSAVAAPAVAGIPLTMRGLSSSVAIVTARSGAPGDLQRLGELATSVDTLVVLMGLSTLPQIVAQLLPRLGPEWPAAVIASATTPAERVVRAPLAELVGKVDAAGFKAPATLVIGRVVNAVARPAGEVVLVAETPQVDRRAVLG